MPVTTEDVAFNSNGLMLAGTLHLPPGYSAGERRPAIVILHGFGGHKDGPQQQWSSNQYAEWGYVVMRFDFRGHGGSEGERGWVLPLEQVEDVKAAVTYMATREEVDPDRIGLSGTSFGGAVGCYAAGTDKRIAAMISQGGWGDGEKITKIQHPPPDKWARFEAMIEKGKEMKARGETLMVPRYDIVPVPDRLRKSIDGPSIMEFPVDTAIAKLEFKARDVIGNFSPRPLLLIHAANDSVTPSQGSLDLFEGADKATTELHMINGVDHFMFGENNPRVITLIHDWLERFFPAS